MATHVRVIQDGLAMIVALARAHHQPVEDMASVWKCKILAMVIFASAAMGGLVQTVMYIRVKQDLVTMATVTGVLMCSSVIVTLAGKGQVVMKVC